MLSPSNLSKSQSLGARKDLPEQCPPLPLVQRAKETGRECDLLGITHGGVAVEGVSGGGQLDLVLWTLRVQYSHFSFLGMSLSLSQP